MAHYGLKRGIFNLRLLSSGEVGLANKSGQVVTFEEVSEELISPALEQVGPAAEQALLLNHRAAAFGECLQSRFLNWVTAECRHASGLRSGWGAEPKQKRPRSDLKRVQTARLSSSPRATAHSEKTVGRFHCTRKQPTRIGRARRMVGGKRSVSSRKQSWGANLLYKNLGVSRKPWPIKSTRSDDLSPEVNVADRVKHPTGASRD
jgi:hypothetical protein